MLNNKENIKLSNLEEKSMKIQKNAKVIEYDIGTKKFTLVSNEEHAVLYNNGLFEKTNTAASYVGRTIPVLITKERNEDGYFIAEMTSDFYKAQEMVYTPGTKVQGVVTTHLGYGVIVEVSFGKSALLHLSKIKEVYPEIDSPSEVEALSIGKIVDVYVDTNEDGIKLSLLTPDVKDEKKYSFFGLLKNKIAS